MNILTCDDLPYQVVRIGTENSGPQDVRFTPVDLLGIRIYQYAIYDNATIITGTSEVSFSTDPILPIASGNFLIWATIGYNSPSLNTVITLICDQDSAEYEFAQLTQSAPVARTNDRQVSLFGTISIPINPLTFRVRVAAPGAALVLAARNVRILPIELSGAFVEPPP